MRRKALERTQQVLPPPRESPESLTMYMIIHCARLLPPHRRGPSFPLHFLAHRSSAELPRNLVVGGERVRLSDYQ